MFSGFNDTNVSPRQIKSPCTFDIDAQTDPITLRIWAKMAARVNVSLWSYRSEFRNGLVMEGHQVTTVTDDLLKLLSSQG